MRIVRNRAAYDILMYKLEYNLIVGFDRVAGRFLNMRRFYRENEDMCLIVGAGSAAFIASTLMF